jgi:hypothetical protein
MQRGRDQEDPTVTNCHDPECAMIGCSAKPSYRLRIKWRTGAMTGLNLCATHAFAFAMQELDKYEPEKLKVHPEIELKRFDIEDLLEEGT